MRPTGKLHLGHLVGALENWKGLQDEYACFFMVADWHALMSEYENPQGIKESALDNLADWLACGIDPERSVIFTQSQVKEHLELFLALSLLTPLGLLERCPTYKEQLREIKNRELHTYGFLGYPVLQAADILLYKAEAVPVGEDQLPHVELARQIARKFNHLYKKEVFPLPRPLLTQANRLCGLDGRKMSKSYDNYIALSDAPEVVAKKISAMFTDPLRIKLNDPGHPEKCNLCAYYAVFVPARDKEIRERCRKAQIGCTACKKELAELVVDFLRPIQEKRKALLKDKAALAAILEQGNQKAREAAGATMEEVRGLLGL
jgi:tryptophanyl-tRNA synthetase